MIAILVSILLVNSCTDQSLPELLDAIECDRRDMVGNMRLAADTEAKDFRNYAPYSREVIPIRMRKPVTGYHGPSQGSYLLIIEEYPSEAAATCRAREYRSEWWKRISSPTAEEREAKSSVRCWAITDGRRAYLLTSHAVTFSALEKLTNNIRNKLANYLRESH